MNVMNILLGTEAPPSPPSGISACTRVVTCGDDDEAWSGATPTRTKIEFVIQGAPAGKERPRFGRARNGRPTVHTAEKTVLLEREIGYYAKQAMLRADPFEGPVMVELDFHYPIPETWTLKRKGEANAGLIVPTVKPDLDNAAKLVCDALNGICYFDDKQIVKLVIGKCYDADPATYVTVTALTNLRGTK